LTEESDTADRGEAAVETGQERSLQTLDGIGPTYEEHLHDAGITTVAQLTAAEPAPLADRLGLSEPRVTSWIEQARKLADQSDNDSGSS